MQRIEPFGWDSDERTYFVLDDNRLYRRTDPPPPPAPAAKPKKGSKKAKAALRASKRRKVSENVESEAEPTEEADGVKEEIGEKEVDGLGGMKWECLAITFDEVNAFIASIEKSRDPNEKILCKEVKSQLLPLLEKQEEARKRKAAQKERELMNLEKLATAKRSSRIAGKMEHQKQEDEAREAERKKHADLAMAKKEQEKWTKLEKERESRMMTREQRLKEREVKRILHEEELANLSEDSKKVETGAGRLSERHLKAEIERKKHVLEELAEEEDWIFDCICGAYGQIDDGTHSIACDKCSIWQHSKCVGVSQAEADRDDFHFICSTCERRAKDMAKEKALPPIKIIIKRPGSSSEAATPKANGYPAILPPKAAISQSPQKSHQQTQWQSPYAPPQPQSNGSSRPSEPARPIVPGSTPNGKLNGGHSTTPSMAPMQSPYLNNGGSVLPSYNTSRPSSSHAFSSPRHDSPTSLPPPIQPQAYAFANGNSINSAPQVPSASVQPTPTQESGYPAVSASSPFSHSGMQPAQRVLNGHTTVPNNNRRGSMNFPSPAPVLTPVSKAYQSPFAISSSPPVQPTPSLPTKFNFAPPPTSSPQMASNEQSLDQNSFLPPAVTGISPTKHSPPRQTTSNGNFGSATPSILPPVASLSPSPGIQNLSPPVKPSEPRRESGQVFGP